MRRLLPDRLRLLIQIDEHADLGPQHVRLDRSGNEIHRAERIALGHLRFVVIGRDEDDRRMLGTLSLANQGGRLEAVHFRHVDVEQNDREVILQQAAQGLASGRRFHDILPEVGQRGLNGQNFLRNVVDDEDVDRLARLGGPRIVAHRAARFHNNF